MLNAANIQQLSDGILLKIFESVRFQDKLLLLLVCKKWRELLESPASGALWREVEVNTLLPEEAHLLPGLYAFFVRHSKHVQDLRIDISDTTMWTVLHIVLGMVGPNLSSLACTTNYRISQTDDDSWVEYEEAMNAGLFKMDWAYVTPNLTSLRTIAVELQLHLFQDRLTSLHLENCSEYSTGSVQPRIQDNIEKAARCKNVQVLSLNRLDQRLVRVSEGYADLNPLKNLKFLQSLEMSEYRGHSLPNGLSTLTGLTSLTINYSPGLGLSDRHSQDVQQPERLAALSCLRHLVRLEMRDCQLPGIPESIRDLTSLRFLMLGYNRFIGTDIIPRGPYLENLQMLAMSDCIKEMDFDIDALTHSLRGAQELRVLRIMRNWGLVLPTENVAVLLQGKPHFKKLEYSEDMAVDSDFAEKLERLFPGVVFKAVD